MSAIVSRLIALWLLAAVLVSAGWIVIPAASAGQAKMNRPPTLLWKSYPLEQRPSPTEQAQAGLSSRWAGLSSRQAGQQRSPGAKEFPDALLVGVLLATLLATAAIMHMRRSVPARIGGLRRAREGAKIRGPGRRPSDAKPSWRTRRRPPLREVTAEPVAEPHAPATQPVALEPGDDLLEALHPNPPSAPEREPVPQTRNPPVERREWEPEQGRTRELTLELQLRRLVERMKTAPASERERLERQVDLLLGWVKARQSNERELERRRDQELRTVIDDVHAVPETSPEARTEVEPPPQRRLARQSGASVESCEIGLWRGYVKYQLYAAVRGSGDAFAESRHFRLRDEEAPSAGAQRALADLLAELERGGWTVVSEGAIWYQHRLQRFAP